MMPDKFSVLMSVYSKENPEHFRLALRSNLCEQTRKPDEMVLVCDGYLTAELDSVIEEFQEKHGDVLRVYRLDNNQGLGLALNFGLEKCGYDIVARSDSDDVCDIRRFEIQLEYLSNHPEVDILGSFIDEFETEPDSPCRQKQVPLTHSELVKMSRRRNPINHMTVMFRRSAIVAAGAYQHMPFAEDYYLWIRAIHNGSRLANIDKCLVHARIGNGMSRRRGNFKQISSWKKLNDYMVKNCMIGKKAAFANMVYIVGFTCCPDWMRQIAYRKLLRK